MLRFPSLEKKHLKKICVLYIVPKDMTSSRHGFGLIVGGKESERLDQAIKALTQSQEENMDLRRMGETLMESQNLTF